MPRKVENLLSGRHVFALKRSGPIEIEKLDRHLPAIKNQGR